MTETERQRDRQREMHKLTTTSTAALGLWEGLSHSALLRSIVIVLKVEAAKTIWREKNMEYEFKSMSLLPNQKYKFKILLVYYLHQK